MMVSDAFTATSERLAAAIRENRQLRKETAAILEEARRDAAHSEHTLADLVRLVDVLVHFPPSRQSKWAYPSVRFGSKADTRGPREMR